METRGGRVHHAYGRCAPYIRNSRTIHAVPMHHHPRFCCSLGAAYATFSNGVTLSGTQWGNKKYMNMKHLEAVRMDASITR